MEQKILKKSYKILKLAALIFILTLLFVIWQVGFRLSENGLENQFKVAPTTPGFFPGGEVSHLSIDNPPSDETFSAFSYPGTKKLNLSIQCQDAYYTILIFDSQDDYRVIPNAAKFNRAFPCQKGKRIEARIDLEEINLIPGKYYYMVADQGETGSWYNPR